MIIGGKEEPGGARGIWAYGLKLERGPGTGQKLPCSPGRRPYGGYVVAGLAVLALLGAWSAGLIGCTLDSGYGRMEGNPNAFVGNLRQSPGEVSRLMRNAQYYKLMGQPELGLRELELAHQQNPDNLQIVNFLAQNYEEMGKGEAARQLYREALNRHGPHPVLANNLCFSYYLEGRWQEAETCFRQTLAQYPHNETVRNNLGLLYCRLGRQDEARRLWQETASAAAADAKVSQALAALGMPERPTYARGFDPASKEAPATVAATPATAISALPAPKPMKDAPPAPPVAPKKSPEPVAAKAPVATPIPVATAPRLEARQPAVVARPAPPAAAPVAVAKAAPRLLQGPLAVAELVDTAIEIRNGTWTHNLARQTRSLLSQEGFWVAMIGNHVDFGATQTIIYHLPGAERVAQAVARAFFPEAKLESSPTLKHDMDVKILLGADLLQRPQLMARLVAEE